MGSSFDVAGAGARRNIFGIMARLPVTDCREAEGLGEHAHGSGRGAAYNDLEVVPFMDSALVAETARRHGIRLLLQFGSTVTGREHPHSDVDLGVEFDVVPASFAALGAAMQDLQRLFPGREVDVGIINRADPLFLDRMLRTCRLLFGEPRRLAELNIYAFKRYQDHKRFLALEREYVARVLARAGAS